MSRSAISTLLSIVSPFQKNHQKQYNIKFQKSIGFTISFYTFCLNNKENASGNKTRVRRLRHTLNKSKLITIKRELGKDVDDHKTSNTECLSQILFTFKRLFIKYHNRFQKSKHRAHETSPRKENFLVMFKVHNPLL